MKRFTLSLAVVALASAAPIVASQASSSQSAPPAKPEQKTEQKAEEKKAPTIVGKWTVVTQVQGNSMESALDLKLDTKKVTGTMSSQMGETPIEGEFAEGKLVFWITFQGNGNSMQVNFTGTFKEDGSLAGTFDFGQGSLPWTATRVKEK